MLEDQRKGVASIFKALQMQETHQEELLWWDIFFQTIPSAVQDVPNKQPLWVPDPNRGC